ncbi:TIGR04002 family protein [uncultured Ruminococcus sp.]|uniref:TIGR04002 family protein n=1 Tax=uncultured Ruminococcus sp. TaxID=165186 RepID=UPI00164B2C98|nr:TIGR04002 family protein [uncultured Ruminococcus sp.]
MKNRHSEHTLHIVIAAMFAAMVAVMTAFVQIKTPTGGYVHLGDSMIYLTASFLPLPYAVAASAIGGGIADLLVYPETIIYTIIIKAVNALFFSSKGDKLLTKRNALMTIPSGLVTVVGYSISKFIRMLLAGDSMQSAIANALWKMPENAIQAVASALIFLLIAAAFDKADIKKRMLNR